MLKKILISTLASAAVLLSCSSFAAALVLQNKSSIKKINVSCAGQQGIPLKANDAPLSLPWALLDGLYGSSFDCQFTNASTGTTVGTAHASVGFTSGQLNNIKILDNTKTIHFITGAEGVTSADVSVEVLDN